MPRNRIIEDIIAVHISGNAENKAASAVSDPIAAAAAEKEEEEQWCHAKKIFERPLFLPRPSVKLTNCIRSVQEFDRTGTKVVMSARSNATRHSTLSVRVPLMSLWRRMSRLAVSTFKMSIPRDPIWISS
jgi:hypothetical protein